ncbi:MAG: asparagine synthase B [Flavobacteriaceae bacterium]|nr:asparagine synthase B [Flavobacteriaceae bacterium]
MCGILAIIGKKVVLEKAKELSNRMSHRGPNEHDVYVTEKGHILAHERLSIIDLHTGKQPIQGCDTAYMVHNGEIYNHVELRATDLKNHVFRTKSDSEVIVHLYEKYGDEFLTKLDGVFAFVVIDGDDFIAGRDPIGVKPLYYGKDISGNMYFASEMKAIADQCVTFAAFPPGHYYTPKTGFVQYYKPDWFDYKVATEELDLKLIRETLIKAIKKRLMTDVPLGALLSGGLDSSLTVAIASRLLKEQGKKLHSFSIGLTKNSPDLIAAQEVADFLGTIHHAITFTVDEGLEIIDKLIWHLETYDVTSIRASTPMYIMSKQITNLGIKVVLSGEGADEMLGGYLYFNNAPSATAFQKETIRRMQLLSTSDCLRADKSTMAHGLEARVPFLDKEFVSIIMKIKPEEKQPKSYDGIEKYILRKAFDTKDNPFLPDRILWRQKEQFSDGVGYSWIDTLIKYCASHISSADMNMAHIKYPHNTPSTKEAYYMREIFNKHFPEKDAAKTVLKWIPKWQKNTDPSGRANKNHIKATVNIAIEKTII